MHTRRDGSVSNREFVPENIEGICRYEELSGGSRQLLTCGEVVAASPAPWEWQSVVADTFRGWMESPGRRIVLLDPRYTGGGYGWHICDKDNTIYWAGFFGSLS